MNQEEYYRVAHEASLNSTHPAVLEIKQAALSAKKILDLGCGDGTRLGLLKTDAEKVGVDISDYAIKKARKEYPNINFLETNIESLPFPDESFDLVYSMFVLEHVGSPGKVLTEAVRALKKGGEIILAAPNFGAPNRRSPNSKEGKLSKLLQIFGKPDENFLGWTKVKPMKGKYFIDADTTVEPYVGSLISFLRHLGIKIIKTSSLWELDNFSLKQLPFRILGQIGIPPFVWWGPQIFVVGVK